MSIKEWRELSREHVADCRVFSVERSIAESPVDGKRHRFYRILSGSWAQIVPVTKEGDVVPERAIKNVGAEETEVELVPTRDLPKLMLDGTIDHALVLATLWRYLHEHAALPR